MMKLGTAETRPGEVDRGYLWVTDLPTGQPEKIPVVIVDGIDPGATVWVTAGIHPDETTSIAVAQDFVEWAGDVSICGKVICVPVMNPAGLRVGQRMSYYHGDDPNRYFGLCNDDSGTDTRVQALIDDRIYEYIAATADVVVSLHTSWAATYPYVIQPRIPFGRERDKAAAENIRARLITMTEAFGLPVVNQFGIDEVRERSLHHALAGIAMGRDGIPTFTPELGGRYMVDDELRQLGVAGLSNVLHVMEMVSNPLKLPDGYDLPFDVPHKRHVHPYTSQPGLVRYRVSEGNQIETGEPIADIVSPNGRVKTTVTSDYPGFVLSRMEGTGVYENDPLLELAVPDKEPLIMDVSE